MEGIPSWKKQQAETIRKQTEAFLAAGGTIYQAGSDESGLDENGLPKRKGFEFKTAGKRGGRARHA